MRTCRTLAALAWAACTVMTLSPACAGEGHDHDEAPVATGGPALPRFTAVSETFELVGVVNGRHITLYLDHYADGSPVNATLELELDGVKLPVEPHAEGEFEAELPQELKPGVIAVSATVIAGTQTDLLAGELDLHEEHGAEPAAPVRAYAKWAAAAGLGAVLLAGLAMFRRRGHSSGNAGREVGA